MFNDNSFAPGNQFVITHELLSLLIWLIEHEQVFMAKMVHKAFASGLKDAIKDYQEMDNAQLLEDAQQAIIDFFGILESHMLDALHQQSVKRALEKNLFPSIDKIDTTACNDAIVRTSIEKATSAINISDKQAQRTLYRELLKRWNPGTNQVMN